MMVVFSNTLNARWTLSEILGKIEISKYYKYPAVFYKTLTKEKENLIRLIFSSDCTELTKGHHLLRAVYQSNAGWSIHIIELIKSQIQRTKVGNALLALKCVIVLWNNDIQQKALEDEVSDIIVRHFYSTCSLNKIEEAAKPLLLSYRFFEIDYPVSSYLFGEIPHGLTKEFIAKISEKCLIKKINHVRKKESLRAQAFLLMETKLNKSQNGWKILSDRSDGLRLVQLFLFVRETQARKLPIDFLSTLEPSFGTLETISLAMALAECSGPTSNELDISRSLVSHIFNSPGDCRLCLYEVVKNIYNSPQIDTSAILETNMWFLTILYMFVEQCEMILLNQDSTLNTFNALQLQICYLYVLQTITRLHDKTKWHQQYNMVSGAAIVCERKVIELLQSHLEKFSEDLKSFLVACQETCSLPEQGIPESCLLQHFFDEEERSPNLESVMRSVKQSPLINETLQQFSKYACTTLTKLCDILFQTICVGKQVSHEQQLTDSSIVCFISQLLDEATSRVCEHTCYQSTNEFLQAFWKKYNLYNLLQLSIFVRENDKPGLLSYLLLKHLKNVKISSENVAFNLPELKMKLSTEKECFKREFFIGNLPLNQINILSDDDFIDLKITDSNTRFLLRSLSVLLKQSIVFSSMLQINNTHALGLIWQNAERPKNILMSFQKKFLETCLDDDCRLNYTKVKFFLSRNDLKLNDVGYADGKIDEKHVYCDYHFINISRTWTTVKILSFLRLIDQVDFDSLLNYLRLGYNMDTFSSLVEYRAGQVIDENIDLVVLYRELFRVLLRHPSRSSSQLELAITDLSGTAYKQSCSFFFEYFAATCIDSSFMMSYFSTETLSCDSNSQERSEQRTDTTLIHLSQDLHRVSCGDGGYSSEQTLNRLHALLCARQSRVTISLREAKVQEDLPYVRSYANTNLLPFQAQIMDSFQALLLVDYAITDQQHVPSSRASIENDYNFLQESLQVACLSAQQQPYSEKFKEIQIVFDNLTTISCRISSLHKLHAFGFVIPQDVMYAIGNSISISELPSWSQKLSMYLDAWQVLQRNLYEKNSPCSTKKALQLHPAVLAKLESALSDHSKLLRYSDSSKIPASHRQKLRQKKTIAVAFQTKEKADEYLRNNLNLINTFLQDTQLDQIPSLKQAETHSVAEIVYFQCNAETEVKKMSIHLQMFLPLAAIHFEYKFPLAEQNVFFCDWFRLESELLAALKRFLYQALYPTSAKPYFVLLPRNLRTWNVVQPLLQHWRSMYRRDVMVGLIAMLRDPDSDLAIQTRMSSICTTKHLLCISTHYQARNWVDKLLRIHKLSLGVIQGRPQSGKSYVLQQTDSKNKRIPFTILARTRFEELLTSLISNHNRMIWIQGQVVDGSMVEHMLMQLLLFGHVRAPTGWMWKPKASVEIVAELHFIEQSDRPSHDYLVSLLPNAKETPLTPSDSSLLGIHQGWHDFVLKSVQCSNDLILFRCRSALAQWASTHPDIVSSPNDNDIFNIFSAAGCTSKCLWEERLGAGGIFDRLHMNPSMQSEQAMYFISLHQNKGFLLPFYHDPCTCPLEESFLWEKIKSISCMSPFQQETSQKQTICRLCKAVERCFGIEALKRTFSEHPTFVFSPLVMIRLLVIALHAALRLPLILEGETGAGKTFLLQIFKSLLGSRTKLNVLELEPGHNEISVLSWLKENCIQERIENVETIPGKIVFVDEINCCDVGCLLQTAMLDRLVERQNVQNSIWLVAACNPSINRDSRIGLYKVLPLSSSLCGYVWTLDPHHDYEVRFLCIHTLQRALSKQQLLKYTNDIVYKSAYFMFECYKMMFKLCRDGRVGSCAFEAASAAVPPSARDLRRIAVIATECLHIFNDINKQMDDLWWCIRLAVSVVFLLRLEYQMRILFLDELGSRRKCFADRSVLLQPLKDAIEVSKQYFQRVISHEILWTDSLSENIFAIILHVYAGLPIFLIGPAGTSKSISLAVMSLCARKLFDDTPINTDSPENYLINFVRKLLCNPTLYILQCSSQLSSAIIQSEFKRARMYNQTVSDINEKVVIVLEEMGMTETPHLILPSLKILHFLLDDYCNLNKPRCMRIPFIALSNSFFDSAKMNRGTVLYRPDPNDTNIERVTEDCIQIAFKYRYGFLSQHDFAVDKVTNTAGKFTAQAISKSLFCEILSTSQVFGKDTLFQAFGLRDIYAFLTRFQKICEDNGKEKGQCLIQDIWIALCAEFGGSSYTLLSSKIKVVMRSLIDKLHQLEVSSKPWKQLMEQVQKKTSFMTLLISHIKMVVDSSPISSRTAYLRPRHALIVSEVPLCAGTLETLVRCATSKFSQQSLSVHVLQPSWRWIVSQQGIMIPNDFHSLDTSSFYALQQKYLQYVLDILQYPGLFIIKSPWILATKLYDVINGHASSKASSQTENWVFVRVPIGGRSRYVRMHIKCRLLFVCTHQELQHLPHPFLQRTQKIFCTTQDVRETMSKSMHMHFNVSDDVLRLLMDEQGLNSGQGSICFSSLFLSNLSHAIHNLRCVPSGTKHTEDQLSFCVENTTTCDFEHSFLSSVCINLRDLPGTCQAQTPTEVVGLSIQWILNHSFKKICSIQSALHIAKNESPFLFCYQMAGYSLFRLLMRTIEEQSDLQVLKEIEQAQANITLPENAICFFDATKWDAENSQGIDFDAIRSLSKKIHQKENDRQLMIFLYLESTSFPYDYISSLLDEVRLVCNNKLNCFIMYHDHVDLVCKKSWIKPSLGWTYLRTGFSTWDISDYSKTEPLGIFVKDFQQHIAQCDGSDRQTNPKHILWCLSLGNLEADDGFAVSHNVLSRSKPFPALLRTHIEQLCPRFSFSSTDISSFDTCDHTELRFFTANLSDDNPQDDSFLITSIGCFVWDFDIPSIVSQYLCNDFNLILKLFDIPICSPSRSHLHDWFLWKKRSLISISKSHIRLLTALQCDLECCARIVMDIFSKDLQETKGKTFLETIIQLPKQMLLIRQLLHLWCEQRMLFSLCEGKSYKIFVPVDFSYVEWKCLAFMQDQVQKDVEKHLRYLWEELVMGCFVVPDCLHVGLERLWKNENRIMTFMKTFPLTSGKHLVLEDVLDNPQPKSFAVLCQSVTEEDRPHFIKLWARFNNYGTVQYLDGNLPMPHIEIQRDDILEYSFQNLPPLHLRPSSMILILGNYTEVSRLCLKIKSSLQNSMVAEYIQHNYIPHEKESLTKLAIQHNCDLMWQHDQERLKIFGEKEDVMLLKKKLNIVSNMLIQSDQLVPHRTLSSGARVFRRNCLSENEESDSLNRCVAEAMARFHHIGGACQPISYIDIVKNPNLDRQFNECFNEFKRKGYSKIKWVFHGTAVKNIDSILDNGFRIGGIDTHVVNGSAYGKGIYTSTRTNTPLQYGKQKAVILAKGVVGCEGSDSWQGGGTDVLIFKSAQQVLPTYVIYCAS